MDPSKYRTWLSSVAFVDVVGFSKCSIQDQLNIKEHLDSLLRKQLGEVSRNDYILLDRGDGAAVCFLVEPEAALFFAVHLRDTLVADKDRQPVYQIRIGINLGPIKIIHDVNGAPAPVGEGINCAARVMDFAGANEVLVARSFYDVIGCQSQEYAALFSYVGVRADKHVREFELYEVVPPGSERTEIPSLGSGAVSTVSAAEKAATSFNSSALDRIRRALARAIGPMADVFLTRAIHRSANEDELLDCLAKTLHDSQQREAFFSLIGKPVPGDDFSSTDCQAPSGSNTKSRLSGAIDADLREQARLRLVRYLGPIAAVLVDKAATNTNDSQVFVDQLAGKLPDPKKREEFVDAMASLVAARSGIAHKDVD